jgi:hypothetical protein
MRVPLSLFQRRALLVALAAVATATASAQVDRRSAAGFLNSVERLRDVGASLGLPRTIRIGDEPSHAIAVADVDGDGHADVLVTRSGSRDVLVLLGAALRPFVERTTANRDRWSTVDAEATIGGSACAIRSTTLAPVAMLHRRTPGASSDHPAIAVVADFDGDMRVDVAAGSAAASNLVVYLDRKDRGLERTEVVALHGAPTALASGDCNGDGLLDLVASAARLSAATIAFGAPAGRFAETRRGDLGITPIDDALAVSDIDRDGVSDIVALGEDVSAVNVFLGDGAGGLTMLAAAAVDLTAFHSPFGRPC